MLANQDIPFSVKGRTTYEQLRPFEVLLPPQFNDGREVPGEVLAEASSKEWTVRRRKLRDPEAGRHWRHGGVLYRDNLVKLGN
ncbi:MAG: hypothetical protein JO307_07980 [Bryobacterales bacterium]|nr:hypothetical protein [Bryobacterales bacterium]